MLDVGTELSSASAELRVLLIAENASYNFGGEAVLPLHYFRVLHARGVPVWMILNARNRQELEGKLTPEEFSRLYFLPDDWLHRTFGAIREKMPASLSSFTIGQFLEVVDQRRSVKLARQLQPKLGFTIVHQPTPVSPKHVSILWNSGRGGLGLPVVMGPMNGGITYPPEFRKREHPLDRAFVRMGRMAAGFVHWLMPGKLRAETLMVANVRTQEALPKGAKGRVEHVVENGVNLKLYRPQARVEEGADRPVRFVFAGRLVTFKGVDLLLRAMVKVRKEANVQLDLLGDGPQRAEWEALTDELGLQAAVTFRGWMSHADCATHMVNSDVFVLPSLRECGGAVVLEAMAMKLPVISANWGGPADYVDSSCGILVDPLTPQQFVDDLAAAMIQLAKSPEVRQAMGQAGYEKVQREYDWERKADRVMKIYAETIARSQPQSARRPVATAVPEPAVAPATEAVATP